MSKQVMEFVVLENTIPKNLSKLAGMYEDEASKELLEIGDTVLEKTGDRIPHDEGTLQASGSRKRVSKLVVEVGYHTPYAARLHEHPEYHFQKGRVGKYLESTLKDNLANWFKVMAKKLSSLTN